MSEENGLPKGWAEAPLAECAELITKGSTPTTYGHAYQPEGIPFVRVEHLRGGVIARDSITEFIDDKADEDLKRSRLTVGDVLFSLAGTIGRTAIVREGDTPANTNQAVGIIRGFGRILDGLFLRYVLGSSALQQVAKGRKRGGTMNNISLEDLKSFIVPIAPLPEQHRIVEKIEELFSDLDAGVASLQRAKRNLKRYRASVLKSAVEGRLTGQASFPHKRFEELIDGLSQGWSPKCELTREPDENEWAIIKTTAVQSLAYSDREAKPLPDSLEPRPHLEIREGDFLMTRKGPRQRAGVACLVRHTRPRLMVCDTVYRFRCRSEVVNPAYLEIALNTPVVIEAIDRLKSGINDSGVSLTHDKLYAVSIPLPPLTEQEQIVALVEERLSQIDSAEKTIDAELIRSKRLRQSILKRAFEGKLVPQDPKDEPASVLLERIKASREAEQPKKKSKKAGVRAK